MMPPASAAAHAAPAAAEPPAAPAQQRKPWRIGSVSMETLDELRAFFLGRVLVLPFLLGLLAVGSARVALAAAGVVLGLVALTATNYFQVHYTAPAAAPLFALCAVGLQRLERFEWRGFAIGPALCVAILVCVAGNVALDASRIPNLHTSSGTDVFRANRAALVEYLERTPGRDLVIVQYGPYHDVHREWVYNRADIDAADVVWARDMGGERNRELIRYFAGRNVWRLREGFLDETDGLTPHGG